MLSIAGGADLARAADGGSSTVPTAQADAVNQALLKKMEAMEQRIKSLEAQVKVQNTPANAGKPATTDIAGATKQADKSKDNGQIANRQIRGGQ